MQLSSHPPRLNLWRAWRPKVSIPSGSNNYPWTGAQSLVSPLLCNLDLRHSRPDTPTADREQLEKPARASVSFMLWVQHTRRGAGTRNLKCIYTRGPYSMVFYIQGCGISSPSNVKARTPKRARPSSSFSGARQGRELPDLMQYCIVYCDTSMKVDDSRIRRIAMYSFPVTSFAGMVPATRCDLWLKA